jgi:hypothetical protein
MNPQVKFSVRLIAFLEFLYENEPVSQVNVLPVQLPQTIVCRRSDGMVIFRKILGENFISFVWAVANKTHMIPYPI